MTVGEGTDPLSEMEFSSALCGSLNCDTYKMELYKWAHDPGEEDPFEELTREDLEVIAYGHPKLIMRSWRNPRVECTFTAPNATHFTVQDVIETIEISERVFRNGDTHHVFFEGIMYFGNGRFETMWGS